MRQQASGLVYYLGASFGAAFLAWGMMMFRTTRDGLSRTDMATASALGFLLLALMRLLTIPFQADILTFLPLPALRIAASAGESVLFAGLAFAIRKGDRHAAKAE